MSARQKRSYKRVSTLIFAGAASMALWMSAAFIDASASPPAMPAPQAAPTMMAGN